MKVTDPEVNGAVNAPADCCVQPEQVMVKPPVFEVPTVSVVVPLTLLLVAVIMLVLPFAAQAERSCLKSPFAVTMNSPWLSE